jgi:hypothetical protein
MHKAIISHVFYVCGEIDPPNRGNRALEKIFGLLGKGMTGD